MWVFYFASVSIQFFGYLFCHFTFSFTAIIRTDRNIVGLGKRKEKLKFNTLTPSRAGYLVQSFMIL